MAIEVEAAERNQFGKNAARRIRMRGMIPGVLYGSQVNEPIPVEVDPKRIMEILESESGRNTIFKLSVKGDSRDVIITDFQLDPVQSHLIHLDFQAIDLSQKKQFNVPVEAIGTAVGVKAGGILELLMRTVSLECLPADLPDHVRIDVTDLDVGDTIQVSQLGLDATKITVLSDPEQTVLTVVGQSAEEEDEEEEEAEEAAPAEQE